MRCFQARVVTPTFNDKERTVISNLDQLTADELRDLNERLYASRVTKLQELRRAQEDKAQLQVGANKAHFGGCEGSCVTG